MTEAYCPWGQLEKGLILVKIGSFIFNAGIFTNLVYGYADLTFCFNAFHN